MNGQNIDSKVKNSVRYWRLKGIDRLSRFSFELWCPFTVYGLQLTIGKNLDLRCMYQKQVEYYLLTSEASCNCWRIIV